jgi:hypothetical protein
MIGFSAPECQTGKLDDFLVRDVAGGRDDHVSGSVGMRPEGPKVRFRQGPHALLAAGDLSPQRRIAEHRQVEERVNLLRRVILVGADLLDDDRSLRLDVPAFELRPDDQLAQHVHPSRCLVPGNANPVDRRFSVCRGIEAAAEPFYRLRDGARRGIGSRPLERDVLHEMRGAGLFCRLQARSGQHVRGDGNGAGTGHSGGDDARPAGQHSAIKHHANPTG